MNHAIDRYIETHSKSRAVGFFLAFFLGPLGLFYSSWVAALILCVFAAGFASTIIIPLICWFLAIIISYVTVNKYNERVRATAELTSHQEHK